MIPIDWEGRGDQLRCQEQDGPDLRQSLVTALHRKEDLCCAPQCFSCALGMDCSRVTFFIRIRNNLAVL